ncbi:MAG: phosphoribosyl-AMP cyclohydrolase [Desulfovibrio sp.]
MYLFFEPNSFERTKVLKPDFTKMNGLLPAIAQDAETGEVLMMAYVNEEAWEKTLETGEVHYYSRSRNTLWHKGGTSGHTQKVKSIRIDCDNDTLLFLIDQIGGAACHKGYRSCFFRELKDGEVTECSPVVFDPKEVYK